MVKDLKIQMEILMICLTYLGKINNYMKKTKYIILLLSVIFSIGCREEELFKTTQGDIVVTANFANTRTTFVEDDGVVHVEWNKNDAIGLISEKQKNLEYKALNEGNSCTFEACGEKIQANEGESVYAYYPYQYSLSDGKIQLPSSTFQDYKEKASGNDFLYASSQISNGKISLQFKHCFAFLKITIPLEQISEEIDKWNLTITSNENISCSSGFFNFKTEAIDNASYEKNIYYNNLPTQKELGNAEKITCYIAILPQTENAIIKIFYAPDIPGEHTLNLLLQKHAPKGGFKPGNVYSLYLDGAEEEMEKDALIALYNATNGKAWKNNTNWCSDKPISEWYGVKAKGEVYEIDLSANNLSGIIPDEIGNLKGLSQLRLWGNNLSGEIPISIENTNLEYLDLRYNQLSGNIPDAIGNLTNLTYIGLTENLFKGEIPSFIGNLSKLRTLDLGDNEFSGSLPVEIANTSLEELNVAHNQFSGEIPTDIWSSVKSLRKVNMSQNRFSGEIPIEISNAGNLESLNLCANNIEGSLQNITTLKNIKELDLSLNKLSGEIPVDIKNLSKLEILNIAGNGLVGSIPDELGSLSNLKEFSCGNNLLTGDIPTSICNLSSLEIFSIGNADGMGIGNTVYPQENRNNIVGTIPENVGMLSNLKRFDISHNNIGGNIPEGFAYLPNLTNLQLNFNRLEGQIPPAVYQSPKWMSWEPGTWILFQQIGYILYTELYTSTDYSKDGEVKVLQTHSKGNGIKLVLMGDAFVDKDMENEGKYEEIMRKTMESYFLLEPFKSLRDYYDVIMVKAVSKNNVMGKETVFETIPLGAGVGGNDDKVLEYAQKALGVNASDNIQTIVVINEMVRGGECMMYDNGFTIAYVTYPNNSDDKLSELVWHEANGHGFGLLGDEYAMYDMTLPSNTIEDVKRRQSYGQFLNLSLNNTVDKVNWSHFMSDSRYVDEEIGIFEGGDYYTKGIYRPTEHSIMGGNIIMQFNAPSREIIYKRVMKLAYGDSWKYDYEEFVKFDAQGHADFVAAKNKAQTRGASNSKVIKHPRPTIYKRP